MNKHLEIIDFRLIQRHKPNRFAVALKKLQPTSWCSLFARQIISHVTFFYADPGITRYCVSVLNLTQNFPIFVWKFAFKHKLSKYWRKQPHLHLLYFDSVVNWCLHNANGAPNLSGTLQYLPSIVKFITFSYIIIIFTAPFLWKWFITSLVFRSIKMAQLFNRIGQLGLGIALAGGVVNSALYNGA